MGFFDFLKNKKTKKSKLSVLFFKSNLAAYEYTEKFFSAYKIDKKSMYHGIMTSEGMAYITVLDKGKLVRTTVNVRVHPDCTSSIKKGDFVLIGISDVGKKLMTGEEIEKTMKGINDLSDKDRNKLIMKAVSAAVFLGPKGYVLYKLKLELDLKSNQFKRYE